MNSKKRLWNCLLAALLIAALLLVPTVPALALDGEPPVDPMETVESPDLDTEPPTTPPEDTGEGNNTPADENPVEGPESGPVVVSTLEGLLQAIDEAEAGATIGVDSEIFCPDGTTLGSPDYTVIIQKTTPEAHLIISNGNGHMNGSVTVQNIIFDGAEISSFFPFVSASMDNVTITDCEFINCYTSGGGSFQTYYGTITFSRCVFDNNKGQQGGHLYLYGTGATVENCTFTNGAAEDRGGAIVNYCTEEVVLTDCTITGNTCNGHGGGIYQASGTMIIQGTKIHSNTANGEPSDIEANFSAKLALMDDHTALVALYEEDGLIPNLWAVDTYREVPDNPVFLPSMIFSMTFAADPEPEEPKGITLTNGKAVLKAPEALYWAGYKDSRGGGAEGITRADLAFLIASMMDQESRDKWAVKTAPFDDVAPDAWYAAAIGTMENTGIMVGCGNGVFAPDRPLTWGELITAFSRFTGEGEAPPEVYTGQHWAKDAINTAISLGWVEYSEAFDPGGAVTCGEMVVFIQAVFLWASD